MEIRTDSPAMADLLAMGEVSFLAARCKMHAGISLGNLRRWWEMPILLKQHWIFRIDDVPRAAVSWAALSPEAEHRYIVEGSGLRPEDWRSGSQVWVIDWIAPFQLIRLNRQIRTWMITDGFKGCSSVRFVRMSRKGRPRSIIDLKRGAGDRMSRVALSIDDFQGARNESTEPLTNR